MKINDSEFHLGELVYYVERDGKTIRPAVVVKANGNGFGLHVFEVTHPCVLASGNREGNTFHTPALAERTEATRKALEEERLLETERLVAARRASFRGLLAQGEAEPDFAALTDEEFNALLDKATAAHAERTKPRVEAAPDLKSQPTVEADGKPGETAPPTDPLSPTGNEKPEEKPAAKKGRRG